MKDLLAISVAGVWITLWEFIRNELLFKDFWIEHYESLGLTFETTAVNGFLWIVWSFALALVIYLLLGRFSLTWTVAISWLAVFVMMWITVYNLQLLPLKLLFAAVPLSLVEVAVAALLVARVAR